MTGLGTALTRAAKLLALDLADALVGQAPGAGAAGSTGLHGVGTEEICQPLQVAVTDERVLGQVPVPGTAGDTLTGTVGDTPPGAEGDHQLQPWRCFSPRGSTAQAWELVWTLTESGWPAGR